MNVGDERTRSVWLDTEVAPRSPTLDRNETADTVVIGSGIAGLSTAYELASRGQSVVVLDRGSIGMGMTARTTGHLSSECDDSFEGLIKTRGLETAQLFYQSHAAAITRIENIQTQESIDCDFRRVDGYMFPDPSTDPSELDRELEAGRKAGVAVFESKGVPFQGCGGLRCLRYAHQGRFHPLKYLRGLAQVIESRKGRLYAHTRVEEVEENKRGIVVTMANGFTVRARSAVVATNSPINGRMAVHTKQAPYRTYAMAFQLPRGVLDDALYWDTLDPYHYVRLQPGDARNDVLIVGGEDHKTGEADDGDKRFAALESWMRDLLPTLGSETHRWSGQVMEPVDYCAFIGRNPGSQNVYVVTGDSGQGITHGVVASLIISGLITDGRSSWAEVYDPARKPARAFSDVIGENLTAFKNLAAYVAPGELGSVDDLQPGHGAIIRQGLKKIAAYRDESGKLHLRSAACTHAGCHVHWNSLECCWDCPCHGSHFAIDGTALNGPAIAPLAEV